jgi:hypothetical protein
MERETLRLTRADFDALSPERSVEIAAARTRLEWKHGALAWAEAAAARLADLGIALDVSEEPAGALDHQRVVFWRGRAARVELEAQSRGAPPSLRKLFEGRRSLGAALADRLPHKRHAFLALGIDSTQVEVALRVAPQASVDVKNLRARLDEPVRALELLGALAALPEQFVIGLEGESKHSLSRVDAASLRKLLDQSERRDVALWIGWSVPRDVALSHAEGLGEQLEDAIVVLGGVYKLLAWTPDNDLAGLARPGSSRNAQRPHAHADEWRVPRTKEKKTKGKKRRAQRDLLDEPVSIRPHQATQREDERPVVVPARAVLRSYRQRAPAVTEVDPRVAIEKGTRVRVLAGPFVGKVGVVQELDGKGNARVMLGLLATTLEVKDLIAAAEGAKRPVLASSHRRLGRK